MQPAGQFGPLGNVEERKRPVRLGEFVGN
jgi:hypothetical protein